MPVLRGVKLGHYSGRRVRRGMTDWGFLRTESLGEVREIGGETGEEPKEVFGFTVPEVLEEGPGETQSET